MGGSWSGSWSGSGSEFPVGLRLAVLMEYSHFVRVLIRSAHGVGAGVGMKFTNKINH